jgi:hypothetical protein
MSRQQISGLVKVVFLLVAVVGLTSGLAQRSGLLRLSSNETVPNLEGQKPMVSLELVDTVQTNVLTPGASRDIIPAVETTAEFNFVNQPDTNAQRTLDQATTLLDTFTLTHGELLGVGTAPQNQKNVFVVAWKGSPTDPTIKRTILWGAPEFNLLLAEVDSTTLSPDRLKEFFVRTILKADSGLEKPKVWFWMNRNLDQPGLQGVGRVTYFNSPESADLKGYEFELAAISSKGRAYVAFKIGKLTPVAKPKGVLIR